jgi:hypothetical protein
MDTPVKAKPMLAADKAIWARLKHRMALRMVSDTTIAWSATLNVLEARKTSRQRHGEFAVYGFTWRETTELLMAGTP